MKLSLIIVIAAMLVALPCFGQSWSWGPRRGETDYDVTYQGSFINKHYFDTTEVDDGHIRTHALRMDIGYGVTNRLAVGFSIPYVVSRYKGADPHQLPIDGGNFHGTFQDYRIDASYQVLNRRFAVTPFATIVIPSHDYTYFAHSAAGRDLREVLVGVAGGYSLERFLPNAFIQSRSYYTFSQRVLGIPHNRVNVDTQVGYFVRPTIAFHTLTLYQHTYHGLSDAQMDEAAENDPILFSHHDQISADDYLNFGGGISFTLRGSTAISLGYVRALWGRNGHKLDHSILAGISWNYSAAHLLRRLSGKTSP